MNTTSSRDFPSVTPPVTLAWVFQHPTNLHLSLLQRRILGSSPAFSWMLTACQLLLLSVCNSGGMTRFGMQTTIDWYSDAFLITTYCSKLLVAWIAGDKPCKKIRYVVILTDRHSAGHKPFTLLNGQEYEQRGCRSDLQLWNGDGTFNSNCHPVSGWIWNYSALSYIHPTTSAARQGSLSGGRCWETQPKFWDSWRVEKHGGECTPKYSSHWEDQSSSLNF
jgi:hypothetical protein